jgi:organic radical activating enzyme
MTISAEKLNGRVVIVHINRRCPLRCRHCVVGFSEDFRGSDYRISPEELADTIGEINASVYSVVLFTGGEPSLDPDLLRVGIIACKFQGLFSAVSTAPIWAASSSAAEKFLDSVPGLDVLALSYDQYHLEFLNIGHYETAARAAHARRLRVVLNLCYTEETEKQELLDKIAGVRDILDGIRTTPTISMGNAAHPGNVKMKYYVVESVEDLAKIPRRCSLGHVLNYSDSVHGCCWASSVDKSPFSVSKQPHGMGAALASLENDARFQAVRTHGFLNALNPRGQATLVQQFKGRAFNNECDICLTAMKECHREVWDEYVGTGGDRSSLPSDVPILESKPTEQNQQI